MKFALKRTRSYDCSLHKAKTFFCVGEEGASKESIRSAFPGLETSRGELSVT